MNVVNPFFHRSAIHYPDYFFGRQEVLTRLVNLLRTQHRVAVLGPQRIGKTSLLLHLLHMNHTQAGTVSTIWVYFDCQSWRHTTPQALWADMAAALLEALCERSHTHWQILVGDELSLQTLQQLVADIAAAGFRPIFLLDDFDVLLESCDRNDEVVCGLQTLAMSGCVGFVVAGTQSLPGPVEEGFSSASSLFLSTFATVRLGLFSDTEATGLLRSFSALNGGVFSGEIVNWLVQLAGRHPLYLQLAGSSAIEHGVQHGSLNSPEARLRVRQAFLDQVTPHWCRVWSGLSDEDRRVLTLLLFYQEDALSRTQRLEQACLIIRDEHAEMPVRWLSREFQAFVDRQLAARLQHLSLNALCS